jgi:threonine aldolase
VSALIDVDLYSDTRTKPTAGMRQAIAEAEVGDEQVMGDPTVNALCEEVAALLGKEAAVYLPSGTMCNEIAIAVLCQRGEAVLLDRTAHPLTAEAGGPAALAGVVLHPLDGEGGIFSADQVRAKLGSRNRHTPRISLLSVEQPSNLGGGRVWPLETIEEVVAVAREHGLSTHLDGARLMNAVIAADVPARDYCYHFDSCWLDFSKGLGAPVGAVLAGSEGFIEEAWRYKPMLGGAMRQAGIIAAACRYARRFVAALAEQGVLMGAMGQRVRAVTHLDVDRAGIDRAVVAAAAVLAQA